MNRLPMAAFAALALLAAGCESTPVKDAVPVSERVGVTGEPSDPINRAKLHAELAALYYGRGSMAVALEELRTAAAADPSYPLTYSMFGLVYMDLHENALARSNFERALSLAPTDPDINHNFGWFLCQTGKESESIKYFLKAVGNPLYRKPYRSFAAAGVCSMRMNNLKEAEEFFQRALQLEPDDATSLLQLGQIRYRQGRLEDARRLVNRYNKILEPTAESLWLGLRIERKLGQRLAETSYATQLRRHFAASPEYQRLQRGDYD
jgi:type IV pilus assembly protein PilF